MSMGNQNANLSNYVFDNAWPIDDKVLWTFHPGITYDKTHMGVFVYKEANDTEHKRLIRNAAKVSLFLIFVIVILSNRSIQIYFLAA